MRIQRVKRWCLIVAGALLAGGCGGLRDVPLIRTGSNLSIHSLTDRGVTLTGSFTTGIYSFDDKNTLTVLLLDGPEDDPVQAVTIRMLWQPRAARTPIDRTATNATIHYVIFTGSERRLVGVYNGAGFLYPGGEPGSARISGSLWEATLRLADSSEGFADLLGQSVLEGGFSARRDDVAMNQALRKLNVLVRQRLGYPRLVSAR